MEEAISHLWTKGRIQLLIRKKSRRDLFFLLPLGVKVKSRLVGWKALKGSDNSNSIQRSLSHPEHSLLGMIFIYSTSGFLFGSLVEYVEFQSPPTITGTSEFSAIRAD